MHCGAAWMPCLYKDYVLFMLFVKYISDKYGDSDDFAPPVVIPAGAGFKDMVALKGKSDIGEKINTQVIKPLIDANSRLARSDFPDFDDPNKLGEQAKVERLTNLIAIFENPLLDFSKTGQTMMTFSATPMNIPCSTLPLKAARARGNFTPQPRSVGSWPQGYRHFRGQCRGLDNRL
jgi:hypothetical protein